MILKIIVVGVVVFIFYIYLKIRSAKVGTKVISRKYAEKLEKLIDEKVIVLAKEKAKKEVDKAVELLLLRYYIKNPYYNDKSYTKTDANISNRRGLVKRNGKKGVSVSSSKSGL